MYIMLAVFSGFTILLSIIILGKINQQVGPLSTTFVSFSVSALCAIILAVITQDLNFLSLKSIPIYLYSGSVVMIIITVLNSTIINKIPATYATVLIFIGQLTTGIIIDYFRTHYFSYGDLIGGIIILIGLFYNNRIDLKTISESC